jgi:glyoxylate/hydroxypyruvate reductase A
MISCTYKEQKNDGGKCQMALLIKPGRDAAENWIKAINAEIPDLEIRVWPDAGNRDEIEFLLMGSMPPGELASFHNLKFIGMTKVGVDHMLGDPDLPKDVPLVRSVNTERAATMAGWVTYHVIRQHRHFDDYRENQTQKIWEPLRYRPPEEVRIGVMGLGTLGTKVAQTLAGLHYAVAGWSRSPKQIDGIESFAGPDTFEGFLGRSDFLISILPATPATDHLLNAETLALLPDDAYVINVGRGNIIDDDALLAAIDSGHLSGAALDVYHVEPLPEEHPFWSHPKVYMTPHYSCNGRAMHSVDIIIENIRRARTNKPIIGTVDKEAGY